MLDIIPKDCHMDVFQSLNLADLMNCQKVCQLWKNAIILHPYFIDQVAKFKAFKGEVSEWGSDIVAIFDNSFKIYNLPTLDLGDRVGATGYLDFIRPDKMAGLPIKRGFDRLNRAFFCLNVSYLPCSPDFSIERVITIFQRYAGSKKGWIACLESDHSGIFGGCGYLQSENFLNIKELVHKKTHSIPERFGYPMHQVTLVDAQAAELARSQLAKKLMADQRKILLTTTIL